MSRFSKPLIALALAIIPFFLFLGTTNLVTVNGEVVSDDRFNLGGLIMAAIGLFIVFGILRPSAPKDAARKGLAAVAGILCLLQIANSVDVIRIEPLDWVMPDRNLPELQYSGLADNEPFEKWEAAGSEDAATRANRRWKQMLADYEAPPLDEGIDDGPELGLVRSAEPECRAARLDLGIELH